MTADEPSRRDPHHEDAEEVERPRGAAGGSTASQREPVGTSVQAASIDKRTQKIVLLAFGALIVVAAVFLVSFALSGAATPDPVSTSTPRAAPQPTPTGTRAVADSAEAPAGPIAPGTYAWNELGGGECLEPYTTPWAEQFTVVDCASPHHGQALTRGTFVIDASTAWPGQEALTQQLGLLCSASSVIDYGRAGAFSDVQIQPSYPVDEAQWTAGDRTYFCFVSLSGGGELTETLRPS